MHDVFRFTGPERSLEILGVRMVGIDATTGKKLLFTVVLVVGVVLVRAFLRRVVGLERHDPRRRAVFWTREVVRMLLAAVLVIGVASIWFETSTRLTTALGLVGAGLTFALQKVVTSIAAYFVILRGGSFRVGDRIVMGGVRGDVVQIGFVQTTLLEMGQPSSIEAQADPAVWVHSRQYTGRIVTVTNDKIFDEPVYNYTRQLPYIFDEMRIPVGYKVDHARAERILLDAAARHTVDVRSLGEAALADLERRYFVRRDDAGPHVYFRLTDNWVELTVRFLVEEHGTREVKNAISRDVLAAFAEANIDVASSTYDVVGMPPLRIVGVSDKMASAGDGRAPDDARPDAT